MMNPFPRWAQWLLSICFVVLATMADAADEKFPLIARAEGDAITEFQFADHDALSGSLVAPANMMWDTVDIVPPEFADFGVFSNLEQRYVGYVPQHRDRFEVRIYVGSIFPTRVALGAGYSALLASEWGKTSFGIKTHDQTFGEVLGGNNSTGVMFVNRIATWRRGTHVFVMRVTFEAEHYDQFSDDIARLIGSWQFDGPLEADPIIDTMQSARLDPGIGTGTAVAAFEYPMPEHWAPLTRGNVDAPGDSQMWYDTDDPAGNLGMLVLALPSPGAVPENGIAPPEDQAMIDLSAQIAGLAIENMLPDVGFTLEPFEMNAFGHLTPITAFNRTLTFTAPTDKSTKLVVSVLLVQMKDGVTLAAASLQPPLLDGYLFGTQNHGSFVSAQVLDAMSDYAQSVAARFE